VSEWVCLQREQNAETWVSEYVCKKESRLQKCEWVCLQEREKKITVCPCKKSSEQKKRKKDKEPSRRQRQQRPQEEAESSKDIPRQCVRICVLHKEEKEREREDACVNWIPGLGTEVHRFSACWKLLREQPFFKKRKDSLVWLLGCPLVYLSKKAHEHRHLCHWIEVPTGIALALPRGMNVLGITGN
jgi:hypothetical protein